MNRRLDLAENFTKLPRNSVKLYGEKGNGISFWAFVLSIFIYISIFYIFNLSPLALFNTTKFWFFISNTLILIIAADFGTFSLSRKRDYYEEYVKNSQVKSHIIPSSFEFQSSDGLRCTSAGMNAPSSFEFQFHKMMDTKSLVQKAKHEEEPQEKIKDVIVTQEPNESHEKKLQIIVKDQSENPKENPLDKKLLEAIPENPKVDHDHDDDRVLEEKKKERKLGMRSKSEKIVLIANEEDEKKIKRSHSERYDYGKQQEKIIKEEENDFSTMSNEELNRRVEEFIRNFKGQIRLQAARSRQNLYAREV